MGLSACLSLLKYLHVIQHHFRHNIPHHNNKHFLMILMRANYSLIRMKLHDFTCCTQTPFKPHIYNSAGVNGHRFQVFTKLKK